MLAVSASAKADRVMDAALSQFVEALSPVEEKYAPGAEINVIEVTPTFLYVSEGGQLFQLVKVAVENRSRKKMDAIIRVERESGGTWKAPWSLKQGKNETVVQVPDANERAQLDLVIIIDGREQARLSFDWEPARKWTAYVTHLSHFDWGYTGTHRQVRDKWFRIFDTAIEFSRQTDDWPEEAKFRYTVDGSFPLMLYLERYPEREPEVKDLVKSGRWDVNAKLAHLCTSTTSPEMLARELYYTKRDLEEKWDVEFPTAIHTDVPGLTWGNATVFTGAGIKYYLFHSNWMYRGAMVVTEKDLPHAYYWEGPAGDKVLKWRSHHGYSECRYLIIGIERTAERLPRQLLSIESEGYPYDVIHFTRAGLDPVKNWEDNSIPRIEISETIRDWNQRFAYPRLRFSIPREFFKELEERYGDDIPTRSGDMPDWWADGVVTDARETGLSRRAHHMLSEVELWSSAAAITFPGFDYPSRKIKRSYLDNYLFDEHTWGYMYPFLPPNGRIFKNRANRLMEGLQTAEAYRGQALYALAQLIGGDENRVVIFNPLGWKRSGLVSLEIAKNHYAGDRRMKTALEDTISDEICRGQVEWVFKYGDAVALFQVKDVPAFGYRTYKVVPFTDKTITRHAPINSLSVENDFFALAFDKKRGGLVSAIDKSSGRELLDPGAEYALGQLVSRRQGWFDLYNKKKSSRARNISVTSSGPVFTEVTVDSRLPGAPLTSVSTRYRIYHGLPYLDVICSLSNYHNGMGANKYVAFPFAMEDPEVTIDIPFAQMRPGLDQLPGFAPYYAVTNWVDVRNGDGHGFAWSPLEGPMVEFSAIRKEARFVLPYTDKIDRYSVLTSPPHIYSEIMGNFHNTNFHYQQDGSASWTYRIALRQDSSPPSIAGRPGNELARPLMAVGIWRGVGLLPDTGSFVKVSPPSVTLVTMKRAEDKRGLILRLYESSGKAVKARVTFPFSEIKSASLADITEHDLAALPVAPGAVELEMPPFSIRTVRVEFAPKLRQESLASR
jgi:hypothetical protein